MISPVSTSVETSALEASAVGWFGDRGLGCSLHVRIERRVDPQPTLANLADAVALDQLLLDVVEEELLLALLEAVAALGAGPLDLDLVGLLLGDVALPGHRVQDLVAPVEGRLLVGERVVLGGRLGQPGEQRRFLQPELLHRLVEEHLRGRLHPDRRAPRGRPVGGGVHVLLEDLLLRMGLLVLLRHRRLDDLALEAVLGLLDVEVADELLGDRRGALLDLAGLEVLHGRADDRGAIDAVVLPEVLVLDRDRRLLERLGDLLVLDRRPQDLRLHVAEALALGVVDLRVGPRVGGPQAVDRRRVRLDVHDPERGAADPDPGHRDDGEQDREDLLRGRPVLAGPSLSGSD